MAGYTGYSTSVDRVGAPQPATPQFTPSQIAGSFNPGSFGGGQGALGAPQAPAYGQDVQGLNSFFDLYNSAVLGPQWAMGNQQIGNLQDQMALVAAGGDLQAQQAQQGAGFSLQGLGLQRDELGVRQGALARQMELLPQQFGLQNQQFDLSTKQAQESADISRRNLDSSLTARGSFTSIGGNQQRGDINTSLQNALQSLGIQRQGAGLNFKEQQAQQQDASKMLAISSKQLGLSEQEIRTRLDNALQQIGVQSQVSTDQLLSELYKTQQGMISPLAGLFGDIYGLSGVTMAPGG